MARLGSVLGSILAELARARIIADELTRGAVADYRADPVLSSMSVPRLILDEAALTLRFSVSDFEQAPEAPLDPAEIRDAWLGHVEERLIPRLLDRLNVPLEQRAEVSAAITETAGVVAGRPSITDVRRAVGGDIAPAVAVTATPLTEAWSSFPTRIRSVLGTKSAFRTELERDLTEEFSAFLDRRRELSLTRAALASTIDVAILPAELPSDPSQIQEFRITVRGQDLEVLVEHGSESVG